MARTHGHGNPDWTRDETILALALYLETGEAVPSKKDLRVQQLSSTLRALPYHAEAARRETFRNPDGVAFKLQNLRSVATGKGLSNTSAMDREIWSILGAFPERVRKLASAIEKAITLQQQEPVQVEDDDSKEEFFEGRQLTLTHKRRERDIQVCGKHSWLREGRTEAHSHVISAMPFHPPKTRRCATPFSRHITSRQLARRSNERRW